MIQVFYDGQCGLCSKEITHYKKIAPSGIFQWCDVMSSIEQLERLELDVVTVLKELHVIDRDGSIHVGVHGFILIWKQIPRWRILSRLVSFPGVFHAMQWLYSQFAVQRFKRLAHCQLAEQKKRSRPIDK